VHRRIAALSALLLISTAGAVSVPSAQAAPTAGTVTTGGKCLDDADFGTADGNIVQIFTCNGSSAQKWTWQTDGTVTVYGKCLDVAGGSSATGALISLYTCHGGQNQKFKHLPDGTVYNTKSAKCLAVQGGSAVNGARVGLAPCDPAKPVQKFAAATAPAPKYTLTAGAAVQYTRPDDTPASVFTDRNGKFYYSQAHALYGADEQRKWSFYTGANFDNTTLAPISNAVNPSNPLDKNNDTTWRCNNSPTGLESTPATGSGYSQPNYCDISGIWTDPDTGWWYGLVHNEFTPKPFGDGMHYDGIDVSVSKDQGSTWTITEHAITSPFSTLRNDTAGFPNQTYNYGDGDQRLFVDYASGYFYAFYASRVLNKPGSTGAAVWLQHVARAPISGKMAGNTWKKWHNGTWSTPGVGGAESNIIPAEGFGTGYTAPADDYKPSTPGSTTAQTAAGTLPDSSQLTVMNVAWSAYLGKYIGTPQNNVAQNTDTKTPLHFYTTDDLATQKWTDTGLAPGTDNAAWYRWMLDPKNLTSSTVVGRTFRSYCAFYCSTYSGEYADITIDPKNTADLPAPPATVPVRINAGNGRFLNQNGTTLTTVTGPSAAQRWTFKPTGDGFYTVVNATTGQALGVVGGDAGRAWGAPVTPANPGTAVAQQWSVQKSGTSWRLVNRYSSLALDLSGPVTTAAQRTWDGAGASASTQLLTLS
jgi:hypothetical protein